MEDTVFKTDYTAMISKTHAFKRKMFVRFPELPLRFQSRVICFSFSFQIGYLDFFFQRKTSKMAGISESSYSTHGFIVQSKQSSKYKSIKAEAKLKQSVFSISIVVIRIFPNIGLFVRPWIICSNEKKNIEKI